MRDGGVGVDDFGRNEKRRRLASPLGLLHLLVQAFKQCGRKRLVVVVLGIYAREVDELDRRIARRRGRDGKFLALLGCSRPHGLQDRDKEN